MNTQTANPGRKLTGLAVISALTLCLSACSGGSSGGSENSGINPEDNGNSGNNQFFSQVRTLAVSGPENDDMVEEPVDANIAWEFTTTETPDESMNE